MSNDPAVAAASFGFVSHRCAKEAKAFQENKSSSDALKACFTKETKELEKVCGKELGALSECLGGSTLCARPSFDLRVCVRANFGFDSVLEEKKRGAHRIQAAVPTELADSEKLEEAASNWK